MLSETRQPVRNANAAASHGPQSLPMLSDADCDRFSKSLADLLLEEREAAGLSLHEMQSRTGLSRQAIALLERNRRDPLAVTILRVTRALALCPSALVLRAALRAGLGVTTVPLCAAAPRVSVSPCRSR